VGNCVAIAELTRFKRISNESLGHIEQLALISRHLGRPTLRQLVSNIPETSPLAQFSPYRLRALVWSGLERGDLAWTRYTPELIQVSRHNGTQGSVICLDPGVARQAGRYLTCAYAGACTCLEGWHSLRMVLDTPRTLILAPRGRLRAGQALARHITQVLAYRRARQAVNASWGKEVWGREGLTPLALSSPWFNRQVRTSVRKAIGEAQAVEARIVRIRVLEWASEGRPAGPGDLVELLGVD